MLKSLAIETRVNRVAGRIFSGDDGLMVESTHEEKTLLVRPLMYGRRVNHARTLTHTHAHKRTLACTNETIYDTHRRVNDVL